jgi:hypothetical protein
VFFLLLYLLLFLIGLLLVLIVSPIKGYARFHQADYYFKGSYLFGLVSIIIEDGLIRVKLLWFNIHRSSLKSDKVNKEEPKDDDDKEDTQTKEEEIKDAVKKNKDKKLKLPSKRVIIMTLKLAKKLIRIIAPREMSLYLKLGLLDPYYTGYFGLMYQFFFVPLNRVNGYNFEFYPVYDQLDFEAKGHVYINFSIIRLVLPVLVFIFKKPIREYHGWFKFKRKNKKIAIENG